MSKTLLVPATEYASRDGRYSYRERQYRETHQVSRRVLPEPTIEVPNRRCESEQRPDEGSRQPQAETSGSRFVDRE
ncbi:hypothetical protein GTG23_29100 [Rhodococcus hoagii]|uniref:hypothetical protein n=1 Tax=Rhodococcus hoagii TaxID=43767 RepID=UPI00111C6889|nr:hypothetical protein [Prescottella equi]MBM4554160.1 hypothetical protein [Prescottella equi]NKT16091.1 hypothetical protein [Prescottella equi]NKW48685.1 hypothetical protein [Prescottella equi]NKZ68271.1 hypothetical protein [Prescottella equi]